jgi:hypothetical protein
MSAFWRRLKYFLGGFIPGCIIVILFFQNRGCSWLPGNRVKGAILEKIIVVDSLQEQLLNKQGITKKSVANFIENCEVDFKKSDVKNFVKVYHLSNNGRKMYALIPDHSFVVELKSTHSKYAKQWTKTGKGMLWLTPSNPDFVYLKQDGGLNCKQSEIGVSSNKVLYKRLKLTGKFDFANSSLNEKAQEHYFVIKDKKGRGDVGLNSVWYKEKMDVRSIDLPFESNCTN